MQLRGAVQPRLVTEYVVTPHAATEITRRNLSLDVIDRIVASPDQAMEWAPGRIVLQSRITEPGRYSLVRVLVDVDRRPAEVVTAYRMFRA